MAGSGEMRLVLSPELEEQIKAIHEGIQALTKRVWSLEVRIGDHQMQEAGTPILTRVAALERKMGAYDLTMMAEAGKALQKRIEGIDGAVRYHANKINSLTNQANDLDKRIEREERNRFQVDDAQGTGLAELEKQIKALEGQRGSDFVGFGSRIASLEGRLGQMDKYGGDGAAFALLEARLGSLERRHEATANAAVEVGEATGAELGKYEDRLAGLENWTREVGPQIDHMVATIHATAKQRGDAFERLAVLEEWQKGAALQLDHMLETGYTTAEQRAKIGVRLDDLGRWVEALQAGKAGDLPHGTNLATLAHRLDKVEAAASNLSREIHAGFANIRDWNTDNRRELIAITDRLGERLERVEEHLATFGEWIETPQDGDASQPEAVTLEATPALDVDHLATAVADHLLNRLYDLLAEECNKVPF